MLISNVLSIIESIMKADDSQGIRKVLFDTDWMRIPLNSVVLIGQSVSIRMDVLDLRAITESIPSARG